VIPRKANRRGVWRYDFFISKNLTTQKKKKKKKKKKARGVARSATLR
jgi:hypothetical protein